jgi:hypothetical protein
MEQARKVLQSSWGRLLLPVVGVGPYAGVENRGKNETAGSKTEGKMKIDPTLRSRSFEFDLYQKSRGSSPTQTNSIRASRSPWHRGRGCLGAALGRPGAAADEFNRACNDAPSVTVARRGRRRSST